MQVTRVGNVLRRQCKNSEGENRTQKVALQTSSEVGRDDRKGEQTAPVNNAQLFR